MADPSADKLLTWKEFIPGPIQKLNEMGGHQQVFIKRLDMIRSWASGNKYYKLKYSIQDALLRDKKVIVSKGGMFSNHLDALAMACSSFGIRCVCMIRSYGDDENNPTLQRLRKLNAELIFLNPYLYNAFDQQNVNELYADAIFIPEGGADENGIKGASEIWDEISEIAPDHVVIAGGTMSTAVGLISKASSSTNVIIIPAWKGCEKSYVENILTKFTIKSQCTWELWPDYHFGGFGKYTKALAEFMYSFTEKYSIPLDPVYTGKMMFAIDDKIKSGQLSKTAKVVAIHTGGLQGIEGYAYRDAKTWRRY